MTFMMKPLYLVAAALAVVLGDILPPSCERPVYCNSQVLHHVQMQKIFTDSKTFVDLKLIKNQTTTIDDFNALLAQTNNNPSNEQVRAFVYEYFENGTELEDWNPPDYNEDPVFLSTIRDESLRQFAKDINAIWPTLGRKIKDIVYEKPEQFSIIPVTHGFIIPGGRFKEIYYWDAYWIIEGLLICGMETTARGMIENLIELLNKIGHIPNGSRWYYQERSQPPLLTPMMAMYLRYTGDMEFLRANIDALEKELKYWLENQRITFTVGNQKHTLLRYSAASSGPRPESYYEDYENAQVFQSEERQEEFYIDIKSAAESGWDFSTRWFISQEGDNSGNLTNVHTRSIIPVDLNAIFANALLNVAYFHVLLGDKKKAAPWFTLAHQWRSEIKDVLWNQQDGIWYDYDLMNNKHRRYFYPSNLAPLWMGAVEKENVKKHAPFVLKYMRESGALDYPGGIPASLINSGEQWDFPNAWPPLVSIVVNALEALNTNEGEKMAFEVAQTWVRACHKGFVESQIMFEKYDAEKPGGFGSGGEYTVQAGFGWSNGVVFEFLAKYGQSMTENDGPAKNKQVRTVARGRHTF